MIIYKINFPNGKIYIGQTVQPIKKRFYSHKYSALNNKDITKFSKGSRIGRAIRKYGLEIDWFETLEECYNIQNLNDREKFWIKKINSNNNKIGYNLDTGGKNTKKSISTKRKISESSIEKWKDPLIAEKMREGLKKGALAAKKTKGILKTKRISKHCKYCGKVFMSRPKENKKVCSIKCGAAIGSIEGSRVIHEEYIKNSKLIKNIVEDWAYKNKKLIEDCPMNKISTNLHILLELTQIKDWRTLSRAVIDSDSRKQLLLYLKKLVKIYAEPTDD